MSDFNFDVYVESVNKIDSKLKEIEKLVSETRKDLAVGNFDVVKENISKIEKLVDLHKDIEDLMPEQPKTVIERLSFIPPSVRDDG